MELLLQNAAANVKAADRRGHTTLSYAIAHNREHAQEILLNAGAKTPDRVANGLL